MTALYIQFVGLNPNHPVLKWSSKPFEGGVRYVLAEGVEDAKSPEAPKMPTQTGWKCFHCGEYFTTQGAARDHFGFDPSQDPGCLVKLGGERGLLMALRKAESQNEEYVRLLHDENSQGFRLLAEATSRHQSALMDAEEAGYSRGLQDARAALSGDPA